MTFLYFRQSCFYICYAWNEKRPERKKETASKKKKKLSRFPEILDFHSNWEFLWFTSMFVFTTIFFPEDEQQHRSYRTVCHEQDRMTKHEGHLMQSTAHCREPTLTPTGAITPDALFQPSHLCIRSFMSHTTVKWPLPYTARLMGKDSIHSVIYNNRHVAQHSTQEKIHKIRRLHRAIKCETWFVVMPGWKWRLRYVLLLSNTK